METTKTNASWRKTQNIHLSIKLMTSLMALFFHSTRITQKISGFEWEANGLPLGASD